MHTNSVVTFLDRKLTSSVFTWKQIIDLLIPGVLDSLSIMFINMLITALISKNGETSVAAVALVGPLTSLISCIFSGIGNGGSVVVAQCVGKKDPVMLNKAIGMTMWLTVLVGCIVCLPLLICPHEILMLLYPGAEQEVMNKACDYLSGCAWSMLFFTVYISAFGVLRGLGESRRCLILSIIINVAFLVLSIMFVNWLDMDIRGSAIALILARVVGAACAVWLLFVHRAPAKLRLGEFLSYDRFLLRSNLKVSLPLGMEQMCMSLGGIVAEMYMIPLGTTAIATHAISMSLLGVLYAPAMSVGNLSITVVGRCVGAEKFEEARRYGRQFNTISVMLIIAFAAIFYPLLPMLLTQYNPTPEAAATATRLLLLSLPALILFFPGSYTMPSTLRAASDSAFPSAVSLTVLWVISIGLGYTLAIPVGLGLYGVWIATWTSWMVRCIAFYLRFRNGKWVYKSQMKTAGSV